MGGRRQLEPLQAVPVGVLTSASRCYSGSRPPAVIEQKSLVLLRFTPTGRSAFYTLQKLARRPFVSALKTPWAKATIYSYVIVD